MAQALGYVLSARQQVRVPFFVRATEAGCSLGAGKHVSLVK